MPNRSGDRERFQKAPSETSSGNLRSSLMQFAQKRPEMLQQMKSLLVTYESLFDKIDSLNAKNIANGELIQNKFWKDIREKGMNVEQALASLEQYILEQEKL